MAKVDAHFNLWKAAVTKPEHQIILSGYSNDPFSSWGAEPYFIQLSPHYLVLISRGPDGVFQSIDYIDEQVDPETLEILGDDIGMIVDIRAAREATEEQ